MTKKLLVAVGLALIAMIALWLYSKSLQDEVAGGQKVKILVAGEDIPAGARLAKSNLAVRDVPEAYVHTSSIRKGEENQIIGRPVAEKVAQGQPLLWSDFELQKSATARRLSAAVQKGQRALTIPVDMSGSIAGMLRPGDRIDVLGTFARAQQDYATVTLLQNVLVLATGEMRGSGEGESEGPTTGNVRSFNNITLSVDPEEAELLVFAMQRGPVNVAMRSQDDVATFDDVPEKNFGDIFEQKRRADFVRRHAAKKIEALKAQ
ncbi:MAG: Flp pilus assembly protein RcpC/CpaB [Myxococcales bacterium]|nr:Flp pilus assembly protein RcpC/CpaB [Myxococcales bacterium]